MYPNLGLDSRLGNKAVIKYLSMRKFVFLSFIFLVFPILFPAVHVASSPGTRLIISKGTIWRVSEDRAFRQGFDSVAKFYSHRYNFADVVPATSADLALPDAGLAPWGDGVLFLDRGPVYQVSGGEKHGFTSAANFLGLGFKFENLVAADLSALPGGSDIDASDAPHLPGTFVLHQGTVWLATEQGMTGISSPEILFSHGATFRDTVPASYSDLAKIPEKNITLRTTTAPPAPAVPGATRLSDAAREGVSYVSHLYSSVNPFNSDSSLVLLEKSGGVMHIRDLSGKIVADNLYEFGILPGSDPLWSKTDPNLIYFHDAPGNAVKSFNLASRQVRALHVFSEYRQISFGNGEGDLSPDGDNLPILADNRYALVFKISSGMLSARVDMNSIPGQPDSVDLSAQNKLVVVAHSPGSTFYFENAVARKSLDYSGHSDRAVDASGKSFLVITNSDDATPIANCQNGIVKVSLPEGTETCLVELPWSLGVHISCNNGGQNWCLVSTYSQAAPGELYANALLKVDLSSGAAVRLGETGSSNSSYERMPRAAVSPNGRYAIFTSDMKGSIIDSYLLPLP